MAPAFENAKRATELVEEEQNILQTRQKMRFDRGKAVPRLLHILPHKSSSNSHETSLVSQWTPRLSPDTTERVYPISAIVSPAATPSAGRGSSLWGGRKRQPLFVESSRTQSIAFPFEIMGLFGAHCAVSSISEKTRVLGKPVEPQEVLVLVEYLKMKGFKSTLVSTNVTKDFEELNYSPGFRSISSMLHIPVSANGQDFITLFKHVTPLPVQGDRRTVETDSQPGTQLGPQANAQEVWSTADLEKASLLSVTYQAFTNAWDQEESATQSNHLMKLLLASFAHELRTPLNSVMNHLEMVLDGDLNRETRETLSRSHSAAQSLIYIINDLLDLTNAENGKCLTKNEILNLTEVIQEAAAMFYEEAKHKGIELHVTHHSSFPTVLGDQRRIRQVITSLVSNAISNTSAGVVTVESRTLDSYSPDSLGVEIAVHDTGCGMSQATIDTLFYELEQVSKEDNLHQLHGGQESVGSSESSKNVLGLGLAVVARIVRNMDGCLSVKSEKGSGSCFKINLSFPLPEKLTSFPSDVEQPECSPNDAHFEEENDGLGQKHRNLLDLKSRATTNVWVPSDDSLPGSSDPWAIGQNGLGSGAEPVANPPGFRPRLNMESISQSRLSDSSIETPRDTPSPNSSDATDIEFFSYQEPTGRFPLPLKDCFLSEAEERSSKPSLHILVAEDEPINSAIMRKRLTRMGHVVHLTENGKNCVFAYKANMLCYDVVLMDLQMPIVDGVSATRMIREWERQTFVGISNDKDGFHRVPIFAVSASLIERDRQIYIDAGFDGWMMKPVDFRRMEQLLEGLYTDEARTRNSYGPAKGGWLETKN